MKISRLHPIIATLLVAALLGSTGPTPAFALRTVGLEETKETKQQVVSALRRDPAYASDLHASMVKTDVQAALQALQKTWAARTHGTSGVPLITDWGLPKGPGRRIEKPAWQPVGFAFRDPEGNLWQIDRDLNQPSNKGL